MPTFVDSVRELLLRGLEVSDFVPVNLDSEGLRVIEMDCLMVRRGTSSVLNQTIPLTNAAAMH